MQSMLLDFRGWNRCSSQPGMSVSAADAVLGPARSADVGVAHLDFQRRNQRLHEVELADRADILAEGGAAKEAVDDEGSREVGQGDPGGPPRAVPEANAS